MRFFLRHEQELRAYARALLPTWEAVEDTLQEASVVMWKKRDQLEDESGFLPWAKVIVRFEALRARRAVARDRLVLTEDIISILAQEAMETPDGLLEQERCALQKCLKKLSDNHRKLLFAPYLQEGGVKSLAEQTNRTANSLYKLQGRLRGKLKHCVAQTLSMEAETT